jgi:hypothetical protein
MLFNALSTWSSLRFLQPPCDQTCLSCRAGTGVVVAALYYQSATKDSHAKDKEAKEPAPKNAASRVSLSGVGTANSNSGDHPRDEESASQQPLLVGQQR